MKLKHTSKKTARRPFTGTKPNRFYNWFTTTVNMGNQKKEEIFLTAYSKLPKPTYKNINN